MRICVLLVATLLGNVTWANEEPTNLEKSDISEIIKTMKSSEVVDEKSFASDNEDLKPEYLIKPKFEYPKNLQDFGNRGKVLFRVFGNKDGSIHRLDTLDSAHPDIEQIAVKGMLKAKFKPQGHRWIVNQEIYLSDSPYAINQLVDPFKMPKASKSLPEELQYDEAPIIRIAAPVIYPLSALKEGKKGKAKVYVVIDPYGVVRDVKLLSATSSEFGLAAKASFESWEFYPAKKNKENSWSVIVKDFDFNLYNRDTKPSDSATKILYNLKKGKDDSVSIQNLDSIPKPLYSPFPKNVSKGEKNKVILEFYLDDDGFVQLPQLVSYQNEEQAWLALTALKRWQFEVPLRDGKPVIAKLTLPLEFE